MTDNHAGIDTSAEGLARLEDDLIALGEGVFFAEINELPKVQMDTEHARLLIDAARTLSAELTAARPSQAGDERVVRMMEAARDVIEGWEWWTVDEYDRDRGAVSDGIHDLRAALAAMMDGARLDAQREHGAGRQE